jgi:predicted nucleic acid-binding Zn ribbon protein
VTCYVDSLEHGAIRSLADVAAELGLSTQAVEKIEARALAKLRALWTDPDHVPDAPPWTPPECAVCEAPILAPRDDRQVTCSDECRRAHKRATERARWAAKRKP